jgi:hypothetical protein
MANLTTWLWLRILFHSLICGVMADHAACRRTEQPVVTGNVSGNAPNDRSLDAAFGLRRSGHNANCKRHRGAAKKISHRSNSALALSIHGRRIRSGVLCGPGIPCGAQTTYGFFSVCAFARILASVVPGVIASGSMASRMMAGFLEARASSNAAGKSSVRSTEMPKPPNARA